MIHDHLEVPKNQIGTPPPSNQIHRNKKSVIDIEDSEDHESKDDKDSEALENTDSEEEDKDDTSRDSASQTSNDPEKGNGSSNEGLCSKGFKGNINPQLSKDATGAAGSR